MLLASFASAWRSSWGASCLPSPTTNQNRRALVQRLQVQAEIGARTPRRLSLLIPKAATQTLEALSADRAILAAEILLKTGTLLAKYGQAMSDAAQNYPREHRAHGTEGVIKVNATVRLGEVIGL